MRALLFEATGLVAFAALAGCGRIGFAYRGDASTDATTDTTPDGTAFLTYRDAVLADQPIGYWRLGDLGPTVSAETRGVDSTFVGGCARGAGALTGDTNSATTFDHTCTISFGTGYKFPLRAAFTFEMWVAPGVAPNVQYMLMNEERAAGLPVDGYAIVVNQPPSIYAERVVAGQINVTSTVVLPSTFVHIVLSYDGATLQLFLDAIAATSVPDARDLGGYTAELDLGGVPAIGATFFVGTIDELAIYDHALAPERITLHRDLGVNGPQPL